MQRHPVHFRSPTRTISVLQNTNCKFFIIHRFHPNSRAISTAITVCCVAFGNENFHILPAIERILKGNLSHANRPGVVMVTLDIPVLILSAGKYRKVKKIKISVKTKYRDEYSLLYLQRLGKKVQLRRRKPTTTAHGLLSRETSCFK